MVLHNKVTGSSSHRQTGATIMQKRDVQVFNRALVKCPFGADCMFVHRCSLGIRPDHGRISYLKDKGGEVNSHPNKNQCIRVYQTFS